MNKLTQEELRAKAQEVLKRLAGIDLAEAKALVEALRNAVLYEEMGAVVEAVSRRDPKDAHNRRLYGQYLINTGKATAAIDLLKPVAQRLPKNDPEFAEVMGLIGRANKQIFFDAGDKADPSARMALKQAIAAYRIPFEASPQKNTWHGVNLVALLDRAQRLGLRIAPDLSLDQIAQHVVAELKAKSKDQRDDWYLPTLAEASLGLGDWDAVEGNVHAYAASDDVQPFQIESTLRQFTQVWDIEALNERGRGLVATLRARLLQLKGGQISATPEEVRQWRAQPPPTPGQLEAVLGLEGPQTYEWWKTGLNRAASVCAVRRKLGDRKGTGFLLKAGAVGLQPPDELVVLTNFHVVNEQGAFDALTPEVTEVSFEAAGVGQRWPVTAILWGSPPDRHDASVLRLGSPVAGVADLPVAAALPAVKNDTKVYIIGHPSGGELAFSFQDNELLDHEGPPGGSPQIPGVSRVHYRAPTEPGNSGSAVFNGDVWEVIALHHKGCKDGLPRLNGKAGSYAANEGVSIASIKGAIEQGDMKGH
jgi:Trypsin-like peptidase domain/MAP3K TRAFs-binding domain